MLHAAALLIGLFALGLLVTQGAQPLAFVALCAVLCTLASLRLFGFGRSLFGAIAAVLSQVGGRVNAMMGGALQTLRAAAAADVTLKPALLQLKTRAGDELSLATLVGLISVAPGMVVVDVDSDGVLVHVIDEDGEAAADLTVMEARIAGALMRGART